MSAYKDLSQVEWAFRSLKTMDLQVRPIYHWKDDRIRAHVFLCMLAYYVEWHMRGVLSELLFDDHEREAAEATRTSIVSPAPRSEAAKRKEQDRRTPEGFPVQSFQCLLKDLATLCKNRVRWTSRSGSGVPARNPANRIATSRVRAAGAWRGRVARTQLFSRRENRSISRGLGPKPVSRVKKVRSKCRLAHRCQGESRSIAEGTASGLAVSEFSAYMRP